MTTIRHCKSTAGVYDFPGILYAGIEYSFFGTKLCFSAEVQNIADVEMLDEYNIPHTVAGQNVRRHGPGIVYQVGR